MIDSTAAPVPTWKRRATIALLAVLLVVAGFVIYTRDFKHASGASTSTPAAAPAAHSAARSPAAAAPTPTTQPPGPAVSNRNPFG